MKSCTFEIAYATANNLMKSKPCNHPVTSGTYCAHHCYVNEVMKLAKELDYPKFVAVYIDRNPVLTIGSGLGNWQAYADRHTLKHHDDLVRRLKQEIGARNAHRIEPKRQEAA